MTRSLPTKHECNSILPLIFHSNWKWEAFYFQYRREQSAGFSSMTSFISPLTLSMLTWQIKPFTFRLQLWVYNTLVLDLKAEILRPYRFFWITWLTVLFSLKALQTQMGQQLKCMSAMGKLKSSQTYTLAWLITPLSSYSPGGDGAEENQTN